ELHEIGKLLGETKGLLGDGELDDAANRLVALGKYLRDFDPDGAECRRCLAGLQDLEAFMGTLRQGLGNGPCPVGQRPVAEDGDTKAKLERLRGALDGKTQFMLTGIQKRE